MERQRNGHQVNAMVMIYISKLSSTSSVVWYPGRPLVLQFIDPSVYGRYPALFSHRALLKNLPLIRKVLIVFIIQPYSCQDL